MRLYLDACILVSLFTQDSWSRQASSLLRSHAGEVLISDFVSLEIASAAARLVRMKLLQERDAHLVFSRFDAWTARTATKVEATPSDLKAAEAALRRLDLPLRTGDALNIAMADRLGATLATFDQKMAKAARALGVAVAGDQEIPG